VANANGGTSVSNTCKIIIRPVSISYDDQSIVRFISTLKKSSGCNKIFSPILSNKFLIRITKFLLSLQYLSYENKYMKTKGNKNFVILIKTFI